jgi:hypothetical protein
MAFCTIACRGLWQSRSAEPWRNGNPTVALTAQWCVHCALCGMLVTTPPVPAQCRRHGDEPCTAWEWEQTLGAAHFAQFLAAALTYPVPDAAWEWAQEHQDEAMGQELGMLAIDRWHEWSPKAA